MREQWHEMLIGKRLPPYSQNKSSASAWGNGTRRYLYHKYEYENMASVLSPWECRCASAGDTAGRELRALYVETTVSMLT